MSSSFNQPMAVERGRSHELVGTMVGAASSHVLGLLPRASECSMQRAPEGTPPYPTCYYARYCFKFERALSHLVGGNLEFTFMNITGEFVARRFSDYFFFHSLYTKFTIASQDSRLKRTEDGNRVKYRNRALCYIKPLKHV